MKEGKSRKKKFSKWKCSSNDTTLTRSKAVLTAKTGMSAFYTRLFSTTTFTIR